MDAEIRREVSRRELSLIRKVPEITLYFWVAKLLTTATGEAASDYLVYDINKYLAVILGFVGLVLALALQLAVRRYVTWLYWFAVTMVAVFGTMAADVLHIVVGVPYVISSAFFAGTLAVIFVVWFSSERTLSIHSIYSFRRELFYWAAVIATFALGTATGDMTAITIGLGYFASILLFAALIAIPALAYRYLGLNEVIAFWFAYIVTRPLGASFADWLGRARSLSGLGFGTGRTALCLSILIVGIVSYLAITRKDVHHDPGSELEGRIGLASADGSSAGSTPEILE
ncbi:MAG: COG4705 family protein [Candidatus Dormibacteraceae bacterium]